MKKETLHHLFERSFRKALEQLESPDSQAAIVDLYLLPNPEAGEFTILDDEDRQLVRIPVTVWQESYEPQDNEKELALCEDLLRGIVRKANEDGAFDRINILRPFSVLMVDDEMETIAELLLLDDDQVLVDDSFLKQMDQELDTFFEKLMSDI